MNADPHSPVPDPQKAPQPLPSAQPSSSPAQGRSHSASASSGYGAVDERRARTLSDPPDFNKPQPEPPSPTPKPKWLMPVVAALILAAGLGALTMTHTGSSSGGGSSNPPMAQTHGQNVLQLSGADIDQAATDQAISELKSGTATPELAALPDQVKQQLLSGQRMFYRIPTTAPDGSSYQAGDEISVDYNGVTLGTYDLSRPVTISMPLMMGDNVGVHCLSVADGKTTLTVDLATALNPVRTDPLAKGMSESFSVQHSSEGGQNYDWFQREAQSGNAVAQYGLGHMYQYGLGVAQDNGQAIHWYQAAAAQNYLDAKAQLQQLQSGP